MSIINDRRKNTKDKSISNRQRFIDRVRKKVKESIKKGISDRSITSESEEEVTIPKGDISEPRFRHDSDTGIWDHVMPGNKDFVSGDRFKKPGGGNASGRGTKGGGDEETEDNFTFVLSYEEYINILFDDLELPDLIKKSEKKSLVMKNQRAGYTTTGTPNNLNVERTLIASIGRRMAMSFEDSEEIEKLKKERASSKDKKRIKEIDILIEELGNRIEDIAFIDDVDLRYNNNILVKKPSTQAVMFAVMDVSYSMGENEKLIAKKFFILLFLFLKKQYKNVEVVFIRHHHEASECDEETFFTDRTSGGTRVSTAYTEVDRIIKERYPVDTWNMYLAQASDGDNEGGDGDNVEKLLNSLLPKIQYMTYMEISRDMEEKTDLWHNLESVSLSHDNINLRRVDNENQVVEAFRSLFKKVG